MSEKLHNPSSARKLEFDSVASDVMLRPTDADADADDND